MTFTGNPQPMVQIDWNRSGIWSGPYDDVTADVASDPGVSVDTGMDQGRPLRPPMIDACDFELFNDSRRYSQEWPASPLYQLIRPATPVQITAHVGTATGYRSHVGYRSHTPYRGRPVYTFHRGLLAEIEQRTGFGDRRVKLRSLGMASRLRGRKVSTPIYQNIRTDQALGYLLDAAGWPTADRALSLGDSTLLYWWADDVDAWEAAVQLLASEGPGALYEDGLGVLHFENRNYRAAAARSTTSQATITDTVVPSAAGWMTDLKYEPSWDNIVNSASYRTVRRVLSGVQQVWDYGASLSLSAGEVASIWVRPAEPVLGAITPLEGTDYSVTGGTISVSLSATSGGAILLTLTALTGSPVITAYAGISGGIRVRGQLLTRFDDGVIYSTTNTDVSKARYGLRTADVGGWPEVAWATANGVCNAVVTRRQWQLPVMTVTIPNADDAHLQLMFERVISDRITLYHARLGVNIDAWIEARHFELRGALGPGVMCTLVCEASVPLLPGAVWDSAIWDASTWSN